MRWVKLTLAPDSRARCWLTMARLTSSKRAGTVRTLVAVGTPSDASMLVAMRAAAPRSNTGRRPPGQRRRRTAFVVTAPSAPASPRRARPRGGCAAPGRRRPTGPPPAHGCAERCGGAVGRYPEGARSRRRTRASSRSPKTDRCGTARTCRRRARRWAQMRPPRAPLSPRGVRRPSRSILPGPHNLAPRRATRLAAERRRTARLAACPCLPPVSSSSIITRPRGADRGCAPGRLGARIARPGSELRPRGAEAGGPRGRQLRPAGLSPFSRRAPPGHARSTTT